MYILLRKPYILRDEQGNKLTKFEKNDVLRVIKEYDDMYLCAAWIGSYQNKMQFFIKKDIAGLIKPPTPNPTTRSPNEQR